MSDSNFLNIEEIVLLSSCLFQSNAFSLKTHKTAKLWPDFPFLIERILNHNIYSVLFGIKYYRKIIQRRHAKKNLVAATLLVDCLKGLLDCAFSKRKYNFFHPG